MEREQLWFENSEGLKINVYRWQSVGKAKAIIQISHGMAETAARYGRFAEYLTSLGFTVYAHDHRGHGLTALSRADLGYLGHGGFDALVRDIHELTLHIKSREEPGLPIILFAHSMGSFAGQLYAEQWSQDIQGLVLSGSNGPPPGITKLGISLAAIQMFFLGLRRPGKLLDKLAFSTFNQGFEWRTAFDWLSSDQKEVDAYVADPYCGNIHSISFFYEFSKALLKIHQGQGLGQIRKDLPILIMSGDKDPVGLYGKGVQALFDTCKAKGIQDLALKLYPEGRHEMLNEVNRDQVMKDLGAWVIRVLCF